jgi:hypothetical protein
VDEKRHYFDPFVSISNLVLSSPNTPWGKDKAAYLRGLEARAKLGAFDAYIKEASFSNVFPYVGAAEKWFTPPVIAEAIVRQNFNAEWLRRLCHATAWLSYLPIADGGGVYRYFVLRVYSNQQLIRNEAKLIYLEANLSDQVLQTEAATRDASVATGTQEAGASVRTVDVGYD